MTSFSIGQSVIPRAASPTKFSWFVHDIGTRYLIVSLFAPGGGLVPCVCSAKDPAEWVAWPREADLAEFPELAQRLTHQSTGANARPAGRLSAEPQQ